jgi:tetratricopeptide (TPR) repeat protein/glutathione synthase/RimK-type ligase-like ATP-grasp enzyme
MSQPAVAVSGESSPLIAVLGAVTEIIAAGDYDRAIFQLLDAHDLVIREPVACNTLAFLLLGVDRQREAIFWFDAALALKSDYVQAIVGLGMACQATGERDRALHCCKVAVALLPDDAECSLRLGVALMELGRAGEALASLDRAIALNADLSAAHARRSRVQAMLGDAQGALASALRCCQLAPADASSWLLLGDMLQTLGSLDRAVAAYDRGLSLSPTDFYCLCNKAQALKKAGLTREALAAAQSALKARPTDRETFMLCGNLELDLGNPEAARMCFLAVAGMGVARSYPAARNPAEFRTLLLFSPVAGNTPYEDLIKDAPFSSDMLLVLPDHRYRPDALDIEADVVVNLVSEPDFGIEVVRSAEALADALGKPVINHPALILATDRQSISQRLAGVAGAVVPATTRIAAPELCHQLEAAFTMQLPLIVRHAGTHGGEMMELVSDAAALKFFAEEAGDEALYLTDFVDYSSADGYFRKYRLVFVGEAILPYHLAIGDVWKVHHASTRMADVEWMRDEEKAFLDDPERIFGETAMAALEDIRRRVGLDYFGIDCSIDAQGRVVVFEVNASMLIHLHNEGFEYKTPHVMRIKEEFERLLRRRSGKAILPA